MSGASLDPALTRPERLRLLLWIGGVGAALAMILGMFGPIFDGSIWKLPRTLEARAEAALSAAGLPGVEVHMNGQTAVLRGVVATPSAREAAMRVALVSAGPGGAWAGGITNVDSREVSIGAIERPFVWSIKREARQVTLAGFAPSNDTRRALHQAVAAAFPNATIEDDQQVAGVSPSARWRYAAQDVVQALAPFESAEARFEDETLVFNVRGSQAAVAALHARYQTPPPPFHVTVNVAEDAP